MLQGTLSAVPRRMFPVWEDVLRLDKSAIMLVLASVPPDWGFVD